jgi:hypothetical protein
MSVAGQTRRGVQYRHAAFDLKFVQAQFKKKKTHKPSQDVVSDYCEQNIYP